MKRILYGLAQCTWGILQSVIGLAVFLLHAGQPHRLFHGAVVTSWEKPSGISLGLFIFVPSGTAPSGLLVHEYGHTIQSLILGPLYLFVIGIPSLLWANLPVFRRKRQEQQIPYSAFYPEKWANVLGERMINHRAPLRAAVTCCRKPDEKKIRLAKQWAQELDLPYIPRDEEISTPAFLEKHKLDQMLVSTAEGPMIYTESGRVVYHPGMAPLRIIELKRGGNDQLLEAMEARPGMRIFDGTLGVGADAVVESYAVGETGRVAGTEASPLLAFLLEKGLASYEFRDPAVKEAMRRIEVFSMTAKVYLSAVEPDSFDVCYFDPMFSTPTKHSSSMDSLRPIAFDAPLDEETIALALRAAPLVVIKERGERSLREYGCTEICGSPNANFRFGRIRRAGSDSSDPKKPGQVDINEKGKEETP